MEFLKFLITFFGLPVYAIAGAVLLGTFVSSLAGVALYSLIPINGTVATPDWLLGILFGALVMCLMFVFVDLGASWNAWHMMPIIGLFNQKNYRLSESCKKD